MKRSQVAIEFLVTYGWAILIVMIAIGALASFGILNPSKYLADKCIFGNNFQCTDYQITTSQADIIIVNGLGQKVYSPNVTLTDTGAACATSIPGDGEWPADTRMNITCDVTSLKFIQKDKAKVKVTLNYLRSKNGFTQVALGELYATVQ